MTMPEAAVHLDHLSPPRKCQIRATRKLRMVQSVFIAKGMDEPPNRELWLGILAAVASHHSLDTGRH